MKISVNIDESLKNRLPEYVEGISSHIQNNIPFAIYDTKDERYHLVAYPAERRVLCYAGGAANTNEVFHTEEAFINRIKFAIPVYDGFKSLKPVKRIPQPGERITVVVTENYLNDEQA